MADQAGGLVIIDKPTGLTSHDVVSRTRRLARTRRVGHAGTLDPMATGVLVLGVEGGTKLLTYLVGVDKTYQATIRLGAGSDTDDAEGELGPLTSATNLAPDRVAAGVAALRGPIQQVPSTYSAIKVAGRTAHARARSGEEVTLAARPVTIHRFEILAATAVGEYLDLDVVVDCSSGTYIRALARDLGSALGVGGHLTALRRTRVGPFTLTDTQELPPAPPPGEDAPEGCLRVLPLGAAARLVLPVREVSAAERERLARGQRIPAPEASVESDPVPAADRSAGDRAWNLAEAPPEAPPEAALDPAGELVAIVRRDGPALRPILVWAQPTSA